MGTENGSHQPYKGLNKVCSGLQAAGFPPACNLAAPESPNTKAAQDQFSFLPGWFRLKPPLAPRGQVLAWKCFPALKQLSQEKPVITGTAL